MKRNRLHITYNASSRTDKIFDGLKESLRCTKLKRAEEIVKSRYPGLIKEAVFKDEFNFETKII